MPFPKAAKRVFKGVLFEVYQWKQKLYDGSSATFEKLKRQDTVVVIATSGDKVVTLKQSQPGAGWFFSEPAGRMDKKGENPKATARRELLEETGMKPKEIFLWKKIRPSDKIVYTIHLFIARGCKKVAEQNLDAGEKIQVFLQSFEDWLKMSDDPRYIEGATIIDMLRARLNSKNKKKLKKLMFG